MPVLIVKQNRKQLKFKRKKCRLYLENNIEMIDVSKNGQKLKDSMKTSWNRGDALCGN